MLFKSLPDVNPNGTPLPLSVVNNSPAAATIIEARGIMLLGSTLQCRLGGPEVSATSGMRIPASSPTIIPAAFLGLETIPLHQTYLWGPVGADSVSITYWL